MTPIIASIWTFVICYLVANYFLPDEFSPSFKVLISAVMSIILYGAW